MKEFCRKASKQLESICLPESCPPRVRPLRQVQRASPWSPRLFHCSRQWWRRLVFDVLCEVLPCL